MPFNEIVYLHLQKGAFLSTFHICSARWQHGCISVSLQYNLSPSQPWSSRAGCSACVIWPLQNIEISSKSGTTERATRKLGAKWPISKWILHFEVFRESQPPLKRPNPWKHRPHVLQASSREYWAPPAAEGREILQYWESTRHGLLDLGFKNWFPALACQSRWSSCFYLARKQLYRRFEGQGDNLLL